MPKIKKIRRVKIQWSPGNSCEDTSLYSLHQEIERLYGERAWSALGQLVEMSVKAGSLLEGEAALRFTSPLRVRETWGKRWNALVQEFKTRVERDETADVRARLVGLL